MNTKESIWAQAEENLQHLLDGRAPIAMLLELKEALDESREFGEVTFRLMNASGNALIWYARRVMEGARFPSPSDGRLLS